MSLFADNTSLFLFVNCAKASASVLNINLLQMQGWTYQWKIPFNPDRTKQVEEVVFSRKTIKIIDPTLYFNNATVKLTRTQKHLGLQLDSKLSFNEHTNSKISKVTKDIGLLRKLQHILRRCLLIVYKYFVRCHLDFGDIIYDPPSNASFSNKIESVQFNAALAITRVIKGTSIDNLYQELRLGYLQQRRWIRKFCLHYEFILSEQLAHIYKLLSQREILIDTPILSMHFFVELCTSKFHFSICH